MKWFHYSSIRYLLAGVFLFVLDFAIYFVLARIFGIEPGVAQFVSRGTGALVGFFVHRDFSFRMDGAAHRISTTGQGAGYTLVTIANLLGSPFLVHWSVAALGGRIALGKLAVDVFLVLESYLVLRILFHSRRSDPPVPEA